ncbi:amino acid/amide ABC transporter substrate-binding protein, HAAT family [Faunimonas pinastri]|uniref:Amino acid/amide ABC transporter substrate-binding protein, HAAT family n=1 Tax=Faunimonas pinastri TaxID=1855383 RepID=A0A1H9K6E1_9HYPH|nr:ABC transporter substrate-binding protein [Faunimonas pinastri]SEQ94680.1 amino acid/amide ABC transporter substrate-binding protein, HAAT family [Faunimonas pinastri]
MVWTMGVGRRTVLKGMLATGVAGGVSRNVAFAASRTIKIGLVMPQTGPLAAFCEHMPFVLDQVKKASGGKIKVGGTEYPFEIVVKDSQSNPNRAAEVAQELILNDQVNLVSTFATPETCNPVADQCELNGMPCVSNDAPLEPYFLGRNGDPKKGFDWTYHYFFSGDELVSSLIPMWNRLTTNKLVGGLWPNDGDGIAQSRGFPVILDKAGYKVVDPGRFDIPAGNYNAQIGAFKSAGCEIVTGSMPPPEMTTFWNGCAQQGYRPKAVYMGKALEFPSAIAPLGARAEGLTTEVWWTASAPYKSSLTGQSSQELADAYEKGSGRQWSQPLGFRHSLFEVIFDTFARTQDLDDPASIRDALKATKLNTIIGMVDFTKGPFPNCGLTPLVAGQWRLGKKYPFDLVVVDNSLFPDIPVGGEPQPIPYA